MAAGPLFCRNSRSALFDFYQNSLDFPCWLTIGLRLRFLSLCFEQWASQSATILVVRMSQSIKLASFTERKWEKIDFLKLCALLRKMLQLKKPHTMAIFYH